MTEDLKQVKIEFWKNAGKLIGAIATLALATGGWLDTKSDANMALTAAATEKATNEEAYHAVVDRIADLEDLVQQMGEVTEEVDERTDNHGDLLIRHDERLEMLSSRHGFNYEGGGPEPTRSELERMGSIAEARATTGPPEPTPNIRLKELVNKAKRKAPLNKSRPKPKARKIEQIQEAYEDGEF